MVKAVEYHPDGSLKRVEKFSPAELAGLAHVSSPYAAPSVAPYTSPNTCAAGGTTASEPYPYVVSSASGSSAAGPRDAMWSSNTAGSYHA
jgi:hypothetical protein